METIIITSPGDKRLARAGWPKASFEQSLLADGAPVYIVIPKNATDEAIVRLSSRFGVPLADMVAKRQEPWRAEDDVNAQLVRLVAAFGPAEAKTDSH